MGSRVSIAWLFGLCYNRAQVNALWGDTVLDSTQLTRRLVDLIGDKQADDIVLLDLRNVSVLADYFLICTASSERQIRAIVDYVLVEAKKDRRIAFHVEGEDNSGWVLVDYGDVVLHVMAPAQRAYYRLEELWKEAPVVLKMQ